MKCMIIKYLPKQFGMNLFVIFPITFLVTNTIASKVDIVCSRADVRKPADLERLSHCAVVEGDLSVAFIRLPQNLSFHNLREITGSLLLYDVDGLTSLSTVFPKLTAIRGHSLVYNYALVIRSTAFQDITFPNLRLIENGGVRVENNPKLCYSDLIHWDSLWNDSRPASLAHPIYLSNNGGPECPKQCPTECPLLPGGRRGCWSAIACQSACSPDCTNQGLSCYLSNMTRCCHAECVGGCYGDGAESCIACRHVKHLGVCVPQCPPGTMEYRRRRCVTVDQCLLHPSSPSLTASAPVISTALERITNRSGTQSTPFRSTLANAIYQGACVTQCPADYMRNESGYCVPCGEQCPRKACPEVLIHDLRDLDALTGCHSAAAIYMSIQDGEPEFVNRLLEEAFARLRVIEQSLRIVRSPVLTTLQMLHKLEYLGSVSANASHT